MTIVGIRIYESPRYIMGWNWNVDSNKGTYRHIPDSNAVINYVLTQMSWHHVSFICESLVIRSSVLSCNKFIKYKINHFFQKKQLYMIAVSWNMVIILHQSISIGGFIPNFFSVILHKWIRFSNEILGYVVNNSRKSLNFYQNFRIQLKMYFCSFLLVKLG